MDPQKQYHLSAAAEGESRNVSRALIERDRFVIEDLLSFGKSRTLEVLEVLELSVGDGRTTLALSGLANISLTCAEISALRISQLRAEFAASPDMSNRMPLFVNCNLDTDFGQFAGRAYDAVVALDIMEHVFDVFGFLRNCHRVLKHGGRLYLRVPNVSYLKHRLALLRGKLPVTASWFGSPGDFSAWREAHGWDGGHLHLFTVPVLMQLLREEEFTVLSCDDPGTKFARLRKKIPNLLFANPLIIASKP